MYKYISIRTLKNQILIGLRNKHFLTKYTYLKTFKISFKN